VYYGGCTLGGYSQGIYAQGRLCMRPREGGLVWGRGRRCPRLTLSVCLLVSSSKDDVGYERHQERHKAQSQYKNPRRRHVFNIPYILVIGGMNEIA